MNTEKRLEEVIRFIEKIQFINADFDKIISFDQSNYENFINNAAKVLINKIQYNDEYKIIVLEFLIKYNIDVSNVEFFIFWGNSKKQNGVLEYCMSNTESYVDEDTGNLWHHLKSINSEAANLVYEYDIKKYKLLLSELQRELDNLS